MPDTRPGPLELTLKLLNRVRRRGPLEVAALLAQRVRDHTRSDDTLVFLVRPTDGPAPQRPGLVVGPATPADAAAYAAAIGTDSPFTFRRRLDAGACCFLVREGERVLHATWVATDAAWVRELQRWFVVPPGDAYVYESYTRPEARGRGLYPYALAGMAAILGARGRVRLWVGVEADNAPSLRAVTKAGFEEAFRIAYHRRLGRLHVERPTGPLAQDGERALVPGRWRRGPAGARDSDRRPATGAS